MMGWALNPGLVTTRIRESELQSLGNLLERVALDDVTDLVLRVIPEADTALESGTHFLHILGEAAKGREPPS